MELKQKQTKTQLLFTDHCRCRLPYCNDADIVDAVHPSTMLDSLSQMPACRCCLQAMLSATATMPALPMLPGGNAVSHCDNAVLPMLPGGNAVHSTMLTLRQCHHASCMYDAAWRQC